MRISTMLLALALMSGAASGQEYPYKPINVIIPFAPGGSSDIIARVLEPAMSRFLKQPMIILNRPGAAGNIGMDAVAKSEADGYTIVVGNSLNFVRNYLEFKDLKFSPADFAPISQIGETPMALVVHPSLAVKTVKELIDYARANPNQIRYGAQGPRSLDVHLIRNDQKVSLVEVPYGGGSGSIMNDLVGGHIQLVAATASSVVSYIQAGQLRPLALMGTQREATLPEVPTVAEAGYPQFESTLYFGYAAPAKTPQAQIARLHEATLYALADNDVRARLTQLVVLPKPSKTPADFSRFLQAELVRWRKVVEEIETKK